MKLKLIRALFTPFTLLLIVVWGAFEGVLTLRDAVLRKH